MRGYFAVGVEGISKPGNIGSLFRSAHAFGASFVFAVASRVNVREIYRSDTSGTAKHLPLYVYPGIEEMQMPKDIKLVGVELTDEAIELPSFCHPERAAYIMGPERGNLSDEMQARCDFIIKIPTSFCINVGIAGAIVLYDRQLSRGRFAKRPGRAGGPTNELIPHVHGKQLIRPKHK